jgi:hypothetical protein
MKKWGVMKKQVLAGLAPLLLIAALLLIPAASQSACFTAPNCPHIYKNGVISEEGRKLRTITWGDLTMTNATRGEVACRSLSAGYLENPIPGAFTTGAIGQLQAFSAYECTAPTCFSMGGKFIEVTAEHLPWKPEVTEPSVGVFRERLGFKSERSSLPEGVEFLVNCEGVIPKPHVFGQVEPLILNNGTVIGIHPGEIEFDAGAGELESEIGPWKLAGKLKFGGYAAQQLIDVKNP